MKKIIAYGENGNNKEFFTKLSAKAWFEPNDRQFEKAMQKGTPVEDPDTQEKYYLDELEDQEQEV